MRLDISKGDEFLYSERTPDEQDRLVFVGLAYGKVTEVVEDNGVVSVRVVISTSESIPSMIGTELVLAFEKAGAGAALTANGPVEVVGT